jgi:hypothetical protein
LPFILKYKKERNKYVSLMTSWLKMAIESTQKYKYYVSGHFLSSCLYLKTPSCLFFKTGHFGDWILSLSSGKTYSAILIRASPYLQGFEK